MEFLFLAIYSYSNLLLSVLMLAFYFIGKKRELPLFACHLFLGFCINFLILFIYQDLLRNYIAQTSGYNFYQISSIRKIIQALHALTAIILIAKNFRKKNLATALGYSALTLVFIQLVSFNGFVSGPIKLTLLIAGIIYIAFSKRQQHESVTERRHGSTQFLFTLLINIAVFLFYSFPALNWAFGSGSAGDDVLVLTCFLAVIHSIASLIAAKRYAAKQNRGIALALLITGLPLLFLSIAAGLILMWAQGFGSGWHN